MKLSSQHDDRIGSMIASRGHISNVRATIVALCCAGAACALTCASEASAAITHSYLPAVSDKITEGVPAASGAALTGPLGDVAAMSGDGGHLWTAELVEQSGNATRANEFDATTGDFVAQLDAEGGVSSLTEGIAVGHDTGEEEVYVGAGNGSGHVVAVYGSTGKLQATWSGAHTANESFSGGGQGRIAGVALDGSTSIADPASGDVYVATAKTTAASLPASFNVVDVLAPVAGGQEPEQVIGEIRGTCEAPGPCAGTEVVPFVAPEGVAVSAFNGDVMVTDGDPDRCKEGTGECVVDVFEPVTGMPGVYSFLFKIAGAPSGGAFKLPGPVSVSAQNGNIYVAEERTGAVDEFNASGKYLGAMRGVPTGVGGAVNPFKELRGVAVDPTSGDVFVADHGGENEKAAGIIDAFGPDLVVPDVAVLEPPAALGPHGATLRGSVDPDEEGEAQCEFEYGTSTAYGKQSPCSPTGVASATEVASQPVTGLSPDTTYHYRLDARNDNGTNIGECPTDCGEFTTTGPGVSDQAAANISATAATVQATIDPNGKSTSYYVQYSLTSTEGCDASGGACTNVPAPPGIPLGSGNGAVAVSRRLQGLTPATVYHYRIVALSAVQGAEPETFPGPDQTFTTQPPGSSLKLADGRRWELVSPPDKHGGSPLPIQETGLLQASTSGEAISYRATAPTESGASGYSETVQVLSSRSETGWASEDISLPHSSAVGSSIGTGSEYRLFSEDLRTAVVDPMGEFTSLTPESSLPETDITPYLRHDVSCKPEPGTCYRPLLLGCPPVGQSCPAAVEENADVPPGTDFGLDATAGKTVEVESASEDLHQVVMSSKALLLAPPKPGEKSPEPLYEWSADRPPREALQLVSTLPDGQLAPGKAELGFEGLMARNAISSDGSSVVWTEAGGHLYLRDLSDDRTLQLDTPESACLAASECGAGEPEPVFQIASRDGRRVFFTDKQRLTARSGEVPGQPDLYVCEITETSEGALGCALSDLSQVEAGAGGAANVQGAVLGASEDGSTIYYVANGALTPDASQGACHENTPPPGATCNLYVIRFDGTKWLTPKLVAELGGDDRSDWAGTAGRALDAMTARVSSDGRFVAFMSDRSLTGYDNHDAVTGRPDEEVFLYDAQGDVGAGRLVCASCDPTGARPVGVEYSKLKEGLAGVQTAPVWSEEQGVAANVPAWTPFTLKRARHQARYLSDSGRLFFDSAEDLVPQDVNNNQDVYEFEPAGVGGCSSLASGFDASKDGCTSLVSSGAASGESGLLDASESGDDVFFLTSGRLAAADVDASLDVYDAHVCSAGAPCLGERLSPPQCGTADGCRAGQSPQPSIFGAPASATFSGIGNVSTGQSAPAPAPRSRPLTRAQKLAAALKACHRHRVKRKRVACERQARKRYPAQHDARGARANLGERRSGR